jgi:hypothetical protein
MPTPRTTRAPGTTTRSDPLKAAANPSIRGLAAALFFLSRWNPDDVRTEVLEYPIVLVSATAVYIQWNERAPFIVIHEDGTHTEQWRAPNLGARSVAERTLPNAAGDR